MKRVRLSMKQYNELVEARDWSHKNGYEAFKRWYDEEIAFQTRRRALPLGVQAEVDQMDERQERRR